MQRWQAEAEHRHVPADAKERPPLLVDGGCERPAPTHVLDARAAVQAHEVGVEAFGEGSWRRVDAAPGFGGAATAGMNVVWRCSHADWAVQVANSEA